MAATVACVMLACKMYRIREAEWFKSRWGVLTMTSFTQAYHCCCLLFGNSAKVFE